MILSAIAISRHLEDDGEDLIYVEAVDGQGNRLPVIEFLGLMELSKDTFMREVMGEADEEEAE